jgi:hypothetical protein
MNRRWHMFSVGKVIKLQEFLNSPIVTRTIISIEGDRVFYRKSENGGIGQASLKRLEYLVQMHGIK